MSGAAVRLVVHGAAGRMGRRLVALAAAEPGLRLAGAVVRPGSGLAGRDAGELAGVGALGLALTEEVPAGDVLVDFSAPGAAPRALDACLRHRMGLLLGTTGLPAEVGLVAREASSRIPVIVAANTSLGVQLLASLVGRAASALGEAWDVEVVEAHHRQKRDAPSGTARLLVAEVARARGREGDLEV
ncbi:MAG: 4-hydroxy-tetrahydrodipicolinate reductase, partial [Planctomycetes bacterium]|nr:4-hydroxy-tetrahydrodipicolinate reductase [Planctomycetota bacterium]